MKKYLPLIGISLITIACMTSLPGSSFNDNVATQVALSFTQTALQGIVENGTIAPTSGSQETLTPTASQTPPADDPKTLLGSPDWQDDLSSGNNWSIKLGEEIEVGKTIFTQSNGRLNAVNNFQFNWWLSYYSFRNAYLEAKFDVDECSENDEYGLVVRAADYSNGIAYYYMVTCDGKYGLMRDTASGTSMLLDMLSSDVINSGSNQTNTFGIWIDGSTIRLYANNHFLSEVNDSSIDTDGHFGLFISSAKTPNFTIHMDEIAYWLLDE